MTRLVDTCRRARYGGLASLSSAVGPTRATKTDWFYNRNGSVVVLRIDGKKVTKISEIEVRGLPEGAVFSPDGRWLYVGNYMDEDISVLRVDGDTVTNTGTLLKLPGKPASMRGRTL